MSTIVLAVPSLSTAPFTVKLIVVPEAAAMPARLFVFTPETPDAPKPVILAAVVAAAFAAVATPPPPLDVVAPAEGAEIEGIEGTEVVTLGVLIEGTLTFGVEIFETFGKNGMAL